MIQSKLPNNPPSIFAMMSALAREHNALNLSQGFPSFKVDPTLKKLFKNAIDQDHNQYAPMTGLPSLRAAIATMTQQQHGHFYDPDHEICITAGATQGIFTAIQACIHKGDEVIILTPAYDCYEPAITIAGGITVKVALNLPDFTVNWEQVAHAITSRTKMIIVNSPHNPSGYVFTHDDMLSLEQLAIKNDLIVISDEVYEHMIFDNHEHRSAARYEGLRERSFITGSFGKTFHITGWKTGYCLAPDHLMKEFIKVHQQVVFCINHPGQVALSQYLQEPKHYLDLGTFYQRKRDLFIGMITNEKLKITPSQGSYFQLIDYSNLNDEGDLAFAKALTINHKIASIPISVFMDGRDPQMLRFCFAKEDEELIKAAQLLNQL